MFPKEACRNGPYGAPLHQRWHQRPYSNPTGLEALQIEVPVVVALDTGIRR